jgi:hypothetical protein
MECYGKDLWLARPSKGLAELSRLCPKGRGPDLGRFASSCASQAVVGMISACTASLHGRRSGSGPTNPSSAPCVEASSSARTSHLVSCKTLQCSAWGLCAPDQRVHGPRDRRSSWSVPMAVVGDSMLTAVNSNAHHRLSCKAPTLHVPCSSAGQLHPARSGRCVQGANSCCLYRILAAARACCCTPGCGIPTDTLHHSVLLLLHCCCLIALQACASASGRQ